MKSSIIVKIYDDDCECDAFLVLYDLLIVINDDDVYYHFSFCKVVQQHYRFY